MVEMNGSSTSRGGAARIAWVLVGVLVAAIAALAVFAKTQADDWERERKALKDELNFAERLGQVGADVAVVLEIEALEREAILDDFDACVTGLDDWLASGRRSGDSFRGACNAAMNAWLELGPVSNADELIESRVDG